MSTEVTVVAPARVVTVVDPSTGIGDVVEAGGTRRLVVTVSGGGGLAGPPGPVGPAGPAGPAGTDGLPGYTGPQGPPGPQGPAGTAGTDGAPGPAGPAGAKGDPGATGPQGAAGAAGAKGDTGATGPASTVPGPQGPAGPTGPAGATGPEGAASTVPGPQGPAGPAGAASTVPGPQGPAGPAGATGPTGPAGAALPSGFHPSSGRVMTPVNQMGSGAGSALTSGRVTFVPFDIGPAGLTIDGIGVGVTTAQVAGTVTATVALYPDDGTGGAPGLAGGPIAGTSAALPALTSTGNKYTTLPPVALPAGRYWGACLYVASAAPTTAPAANCLTNTAPSLPALSGNSIGTSIRGYEITGQTTMPTAGTLAPVGASTVPILALRAA